MARFVINSKLYNIIVDTGATLSLIPERGQLVRELNIKFKSANVNVTLADASNTYIDKKAELYIKPFGAKFESTRTNFYVNNGAKDILGYPALIGLSQLKLFPLNIKTSENGIEIYFDDNVIGREEPALKHVTNSVKIDDRFDKLELDIECVSILKHFKSVFVDLDENSILGEPMRIHTVHKRPIFAKQKQYKEEEKILMKAHLDSLLKSNIIETTNSGYAATSRMIPKKSGGQRMVINYIPLNRVTLRDSYSLPNINELFTCLAGNKYFSTMDCTQGFYQIEVDHRDRHKTAFSTPYGNFQFNRCPFGLRNSPAVFQSRMNSIFWDGLYKRCVIYVDDILVLGKSKQDHLDNLRWVLARCQANNVKIKLE